MTRVCHVLDASFGWEQRIAFSTLRDRLDSTRFDQQAAALAPVLLSGVRRLHPPGPARLFGAVLLRRRLAGGADLIHAWGIDAAAAARAATNRPLVVELFDPTLVTANLDRIRALDDGGAVAWIASSGIVRRRLIEGGVAPDRCVVVRPAVDFAEIARLRRGTVSADLGLGGQTLVLVPSAVSNQVGAADAFQAATLVNHLCGTLQIVLSGTSRQVGRIERRAANAPSRPTLVRTYDRFEEVELIAVADVVLIPAGGDVSTTSIAWAMAGGAVVIGAAVPAIAELITHKVNGLLYNPKAECGPVVSIAKLLLGETESFPRLREAARGQAYEVFGVRLSVDQHTRLYENLLAGKPVSDGIVDAALTA